MILVFLLFLLLLIIYLMQIKIAIQYEITNDKNIINTNYLVKLGIFITKKIKLFEIPINKQKANEKKIIEKVKEEINNHKENFTNKNEENLIKNLKYIKYDIDKFNIKLSIGTENAIITSFLVAIVSSIIGIFIGNFIKNYKIEKHSFQVNPIYNDQLIIDGSANCIIYLSLVHIIYMTIKMREGKKYVRTSNRRTYENNYE